MDLNLPVFGEVGWRLIEAKAHLPADADFQEALVGAQANGLVWVVGESGGGGGLGCVRLLSLVFLDEMFEDSFIFRVAGHQWCFSFLLVGVEFVPICSEGLCEHSFPPLK